MSTLSSGSVLNAIEVLGAVLCTVFTMVSKKKVLGRKANPTRGSAHDIDKQSRHAGVESERERKRR